MDLTKRDMTLTYGGRTFAIRAYRDDDGPGGTGWCPVIIENRTPLRHDPGSNPSLAGCFAAAVAFVTTMVEVDADATVASAVA